MSAIPAARRPRFSVGSHVLGWCGLIALLLIWQLVGTVTKTVSSVPFTTALISAVQTVFGPAFLHDIVPSIIRVLVGFAGAAIVGLVLGVLIGSFPKVLPWITPLIEFGRAVPPPLLLPIVLLAVGIGEQLIITVIVISAFWPVLINTIDGIRRVEPLLLETARSLHLGRATRAFLVTLPAALPSIMSGLRIALGFSMIMMVVAEMLGSANGIGYLVLYAQQTFNVTGTYGGVLLLAVLGLLLDTIFVLIERRALAWHPNFNPDNS